MLLDDWKSIWPTRPTSGVADVGNGAVMVAFTQSPGWQVPLIAEPSMS